VSSSTDEADEAVESYEETLQSRTCVEPDPFGKRHNSLKGFYRLIKPYIRRIGVTDEDHEYVALSAVKRAAEMPDDTSENLVEYLDGDDPQVMEVDGGQ
jgi:hypothetical protein